MDLKLIVIFCASAVAGYLAQRRCMLGCHRLAFAYGLLNEQRPWCWSITVSCDRCRKKLHEFNLDERDAEAFLAKRRRT